MKRLFYVLLLCAVASQMCLAQVVCKRALVFGIGYYEDKSWARINGDVDVDYAVRMLSAMGYNDIYALKNELATKEAMVEAFMELEERCEEGDIVYIHYSGHGQLMTDLNGDESFKWNGEHSKWDGAWVPYDAYMTYGENDKGEKHLSDDEIAQLLTAIRKKVGSSGEIVVVVDACHSGDATCGIDDDAPVRGIGVKFNIPFSGDVPVEKPAEEQWLTISACKPYQLNMEMKDPKVGKLTYALYTMGKKAFDKDNEVLQAELIAFMKKNAGRLPQTPMVTGKKKLAR